MEEKRIRRKIVNFRLPLIKGLSFFLILCAPFLVWICFQMRQTSLQFLDRHGTEHTLSLSAGEKEKLFHLMRLLFAEDNFAYTLLGRKPMSWATYRNPLPFTGFLTFRQSLLPYCCTLRAGWKVWSKYRDQLPPLNFWAENFKYHPGAVSILIVNEEHFNRLVNEYQEDFQKILNRQKVTGSQLLTEAATRSLIDEILQGHQALLGIVLGYGRNNSWEFLAKSNTNEPLGCVWDDINTPKSQGLRTRQGSVTIEECLLLESLPSFAGYPDSEESLSLKKDYLLTQQEIFKYYRGKDFLETTLSLLAGFRPDQ